MRQTRQVSRPGRIRDGCHSCRGPQRPGGNEMDRISQMATTSSSRRALRWGYTCPKRGRCQIPLESGESVRLFTVSASRSLRCQLGILGRDEEWDTMTEEDLDVLEDEVGRVQCLDLFGRKVGGSLWRKRHGHTTANHDLVTSGGAGSSKDPLWAVSEQLALKGGDWWWRGREVVARRGSEFGI